MNLWYVTLFFLSFSLSISRSFFFSFFSFSRVNIDIVCLSVCCVRVRLSFWLLRVFVSHTYGRTAFIVTRFISLLCAVHFVSCFVHRLHRNNEMKKKIINRKTKNGKNKNYTHAHTGTGEILAKMRCERKFLAVRMEHFWCVMRPVSVANIRWH